MVDNSAICPGQHGRCTYRMMDSGKNVPHKLVHFLVFVLILRERWSNWSQNLIADRRSLIELQGEFYCLGQNFEIGTVGQVVRLYSWSNLSICGLDMNRSTREWMCISHNECHVAFAVVRSKADDREMTIDIEQSIVIQLVTRSLG